MKINAQKKILILHPFLFAIFPILYMYSYNIGRASFSDTVIPIAVLLGFTFLLVSAMQLFLNDHIRAGLITTFFLILFFSYGYAYDVIYGWRIGGFIISRHRYLLIAWGLLFISACYLIVRYRGSLTNLTKVLNNASLSIVIITLIYSLSHETRAMMGRMEYKKIVKANNGDMVKEPKNTGVNRDIYYIILDAYTSSNNLREFFGFDNNELTDFLVKKGFYIAPKSVSNYNLTMPSLASSLNMQYLDSLTDILGERSKDMILMYGMISRNKVAVFLKSRGYKYIHVGSPWNGTSYNSYADINIQTGVTNEFLMALFKTTILRPAEMFIRKGYRKSILDSFERLAEVSKLEGPKFVFAHLYGVHPPYLFGPNGELLDGADEAWTSNDNIRMNETGYISQLIFVNKKLKELIEKIFLYSKNPPIIILQGDHGPHYFDKIEVRKKFRIINAYYLPLDREHYLYESITPVNTFRLILNLYFKTDYKLLEDRSYFTDSSAPCKYIDITEKMRD